jgi:kynurenine 3-monooxygenase
MMFLIVFPEKFLHIPNMNLNAQKIAIAGAGLVGTLLSIFLAKRGYSVRLFEKRSDPRSNDAHEGRSINLALSHRGIHALKKAGLDQRVLAGAVPMYGRRIHPLGSASVFQPYGEKDQCIYSISRKGLNSTLLDAASGYSNIQLNFNVKASLEQNENHYFLQTESLITHTIQKHKFDFIASCDGAFSVVREKLIADGHCEATLDKLDHGYLELDIPSGLAGSLERNALHIWPREDFMLIALPNLDGSFTCTLFLPFKGKNSFENIKSDSDARSFFNTWFPDALPLIQDFEKQYFRMEPSFLATVHSYPWLVENVFLLGDAAHAIVPFYGQGMNAGFEDVRILDEVLQENGDLKVALNEVQKLRKPNADAIADLALQNFVEMRDLVDDPQFQLQKKMEARLHLEFPNYLPQYSLVTFSDTPYSEALQKGREHNAMMKKVLALPNIAQRWNTEEGWKEVIFVLKSNYPELWD